MPDGGSVCEGILHGVLADLVVLGFGGRAGAGPLPRLWPGFGPRPGPRFCPRAPGAGSMLRTPPVVPFPESRLHPSSATNFTRSQID